MKQEQVEYPSLALIRQGVDYRFEIKSRALTLIVRPLSIMEEDQITQEVIDEMKKLEPENKTRIRESTLLAIKKLSRATSSDVGANDHRIREIELQRMLPGEFDHLFKQYIAGSDKLNPMFSSYDRREVEAWIEDLKKNSSEAETTLIELSFFQLVAICLRLLTTGDSPAVK